MKRLSDQSLYEILEVPVGSTPEDIEKAYERAKVLYAPGSIVTYTLIDPEEAQYLARRIEEAHTVLLDPMARASYDAGLASEPQPRPEPVVPQPRPEPAPVAPSPKPEPAPVALQPQPKQTPAALPRAPQRQSALFPRIIPPLRTALTPQVASPNAEPVGSTQPVPPDRIADAAAAPETRSAPPPRPPAAPPVHVAPPAQAPEPREFRVPEGTPWNGETLRRVREGRGLTLQQIAERTKVSRHHLESIEADRYTMLPAPVYLRGFLMSFSKELRLDGQKVARSYLELVSAATADAAIPKPR